MQFIECLGHLRSGNLSADVIQYFRTLMRPLPPRDDGLLPTLLKVTNAAANDINTSQLKKLKQTVHTFSCLDGSQRGADDPRTKHTDERHSRACAEFRQHCNAEQQIEFALGAQVVSCSQAVVVLFSTSTIV